MTNPNILFITCHDLGRHIGCYGNKTVNTPHLDQLASKGVLFENSFCASPTCSPSRAALHTGRYPHANGMMGLVQRHWRLKSDEKHMARRLKEAGYSTALIGTQHVISQNDVHQIGYDEVFPDCPAPIQAQTAREYLRKSAGSDRPFYLEVGFSETHRPWFREGSQPDESKGVDVPGYMPDCDQSREDIAALQGWIRNLDAAVGAILSALSELDLENNTWVVFTPDHGLPLPGAKGNLYDPGIETALLMYWPTGGIRGGKRYTEMIHNIDIVPTMLDGLRLPMSQTIQGMSFWNLLQGSSYEERSEIFTERNYHLHYDPARSVRTKTHKLIVHFESGPRIDVPGDVQRESPVVPVMLKEILRERPKIELYDLRSDPSETNNVSGNTAYTEVERRLKDRLALWMESTQDPLLEGPIPSPYYNKSMAWMRCEQEGTPR